MAERLAAVARRLGPLPFAAIGTVWATAIAVGGFPWGYDSHAYWLTRHGIGYHMSPIRDRYLYSPAFAEAIRPLTSLPWPVFAALWSLGAAAVYLWVTSGIDWRWRLPLLCVCLTDVAMGNVWWLFVLAAVRGCQRPMLWAIPLLTKITPAVGLIWFAARREWRSAAIAFGIAGLIASVSAAVSPDAWIAWMHFLVAGRGSDPSFYPRLIAAAVVVVWAAPRSRVDLLPIAIILATPIVALGSLVMLAALPRLRRESQHLELRRRTSARDRYERSVSPAAHAYREASGRSTT